jgi:hypothetical protein
VIYSRVLISSGRNYAVVARVLKTLTVALYVVEELQ